MANKTFEVRGFSTASGIRHTVYIRENGKCIDSKSFSPTDGRWVKNEHGFKHFEPLTPTAQERCAAFVEQLKADGYTDVIPSIAKLYGNHDEE